MQEKMKECIDQWLEHQKKPEVKLAIFGYTEEDIKSNPEKSQYLVINYDKFSHFHCEIKSRLGIKVKISDLPSDITKLELIISHSDAISEFIEAGLLSSIIELPDDNSFLETLFENEMAITHLKELNVITSLSDVKSKINNLSVLKDYGATTDKAIEILESQGSKQDVLKAKLAKAVYLMTEEQQENEELAVQELIRQGNIELLNFYKEQNLESEIVGDNTNELE